MTTRLAKAGLAALIGAVAFGAYPAAQDSDDVSYARVLLISIDGMRAADLDWYTSTYTQSALAILRQHGRTYTNATGTKPSDSFPGLLAMVTGGTPRSTGVYYDDSWDRALAGDVTKPCSPGVEVTWKQNLDNTASYPPSFLDWNAYAGYWATHAGAIDSNKLPRDPAVSCPSPVFPHQYPRVNNVFELVKAAGGRTAWSDKHPAYEFLNGPSNTGVDDLYTPEIAIPPIQPPLPPPATAGTTITNSFDLTMKYDMLKVTAIVNEINGYDHVGPPTGTVVGVPTLFGMNFQAVSVGQKLKNETYPPALPSTRFGGYVRDQQGNLVPNTGLVDALNNTDAGIGAMMKALNDRGLAGSTLIIISAKHGNSPVDPATLAKRPVSSITGIIDAYAASQGLPKLWAQVSADTGPLVWLTPTGQNHTADIVAAFNTSILGSNAAHLQGVLLSGNDLKAFYGADPLSDARVPDIVLDPIPGTVYTTSGTKIADHGSFHEDDVHVALLVSSPGLPQKTIDDPVETRQIACTILKALAMDCNGLQSEQIEPSKFLPNSNHKNQSPDGPGLAGGKPKK